MRTTLLGAAATGALAVALAGALPAAGSPPPVGTLQYVVRVDPRLCPSPLCGGFWVALANRPRTRCSDGALRPRCYVARAFDENRHALAASLPDGSVGRADIEPWTVEGFGELGALVVADIRAPVGSGSEGSYYRLRDLGVRCVRAPCFSFRAARLNGSSRVRISSLDFAPARLTGQQLKRARAALATPNGLFLLGRVADSGRDGRTLRASRIFLRVALPRG